MKRTIITVDMQAEDRFAELREALVEPNSHIISSVEAEGKIVYVVEVSDRKPRK